MSLRVLQQNGEAAPDAGFSSDTRPKHVQNGCASCLVRHPAICAAPMTSASVATGRAMRMSFSTVSVKTDTS